MPYELLTPGQMAEADRLTVALGHSDGMSLMRRAGEAVASAVLSRHPAATRAHVLAGPGNNGGDGYVVARLLAERGVAVRLWRDEPPRPGGDAAAAAAGCPLEAEALGDFRPEKGDLVIDALFGAGLTKALGGHRAAAVDRTVQSGAAVVAIDLPSGISGDSGAVLGTAFRADQTVTFFRKKPGHLLLPGRMHCGEVIVEDIGIPTSVLDRIRPVVFENHPELWQGSYPTPAAEAHKYSRGHVAVLSGGVSSTGAARLAAMAAARAGAGAVTLLSSRDALAVNAAQLTSTMLREVESPQDVLDFLRLRQPGAIVAGPGAGTGERMRALAFALVEEAAGFVQHIVFDADAITVLAEQRERLIAASADGRPALLLTPHEGEFRRLFPKLAAEPRLSKLQRAIAASSETGAYLILKGPDTIIAGPDGRAAINANGTPLLATAGSGDVLAGIAAGLLAQGMPGFEAACAAVWVHAEAARLFGPGLIAEDLPAMLPQVIRVLARA